MAILRLKTHIFALAYSVFFFYSFHVDFQNLHEFHVDFFKTLTVEFYMKTVEKKVWSIVVFYGVFIVFSMGFH